MIDVHLPATEDEALLWRRDARLLLDFLLDSGDLQQHSISQRKIDVVSRECLGVHACKSLPCRRD